MQELSRARQARPGGRRHGVVRARGRLIAGDRRRVGRGQDHDRPHPRRARAPEQRHRAGRRSRAGRHARRGGRAPAPGARDPDRLPGPLPVARPAPARGRLHRRDPAPALRWVQARARHAHRRAARPGRPGSPSRRLAPARALRGRAPARGDRARARGAAGDPDPRRGRVGARRLDPGPGPQPAGRHPARHRHGLPADLARPRGRAPAGRRRARDAQGQGARDRSERPGPALTAPSLHAPAARIGAARGLAAAGSARPARVRGRAGALLSAPQRSGTRSRTAGSRRWWR